MFEVSKFRSLYSVEGAAQVFYKAVSCRGRRSGFVFCQGVPFRFGINLYSVEGAALVLYKLVFGRGRRSGFV